MKQINRTGKINFGDASMHLIEEGLGGSYRQREEWEKAFKVQVFKRVIQQLNRIGWKCVVPQDKTEQYGKAFAAMYRYCVKGDLKADLSVSGRCIDLKMFQNINAPDRPDHEGRYQCDRELHMPYLLRLEMERTRRKIRDHLCSVFTNYKINDTPFDGRTNRCGPTHRTAMEWLEGCYETSCHFKGDITSYEISKGNKTSADNELLIHGQRVYFYDRKGRMKTGIAYYNINNMWWVIMGKYDHTNKAAHSIFTKIPGNVREKKNDELRKKRLESLMSEAAKGLEYERAAQLRDILILCHGLTPRVATSTN
jgi:hypothetical protein